MRIFITLWAVLLASMAAAQTGQKGTGKDGCYFGSCDRPGDTGELQRVPIKPTPTEILICNTHFGSCQMPVGSVPGAICNCPGIASGYPAIGTVQGQSSASYASIPNISSICGTPFGACAMAVQMPRDQNCYCPSMQGPIWGVSR